jgi:hypothetical protein
MYHGYFVNYLKFLYGGNTKINGSILWIYTEEDVFKVNLTDYQRFGKYTFFHKNRFPNDGNFHKQMTCCDLEYGLFRCFTHYFNRRYRIPYSKEDWECFRRDALKYKM